MDDRLYFRQLLAGRDFARDDMVARQMVNFVYLIGDRETGEAVVVDPAYGIRELLDVVEADGMKLVGALGDPLPPRPRGWLHGRLHDRRCARAAHPQPGAHPRAGRRGAVGAAGDGSQRERSGAAPLGRRRDGRRHPDRADPHPGPHPRQPVLLRRRHARRRATRCSSRAAAAPTCPAATPPRSTRASPPSWPRCPTTLCSSLVTSTPPSRRPSWARCASSTTSSDRSRPSSGS